MTKNKIFLGGTRNGSTWRKDVIEAIAGKVDYFDPTVEEVTPKSLETEWYQKEHECNIHLYVITADMVGVLDIAEAMDSVHNPRVKTHFHVDAEGFSDAQLKSLEAVVALIQFRGGVGGIHGDKKELATVLDNPDKTFWVPERKKPLEGVCGFLGGYPNLFTLFS